MQGATPDEVKAKLGKILQGADPPHSEDAVAALLGDAGFEPPMRFFSSLFWGRGSRDGVIAETKVSVTLTVHWKRQSVSFDAEIA